MMSIGDLSRRTGVKVPTIRFYEQRGLLAEAERTEGNQRRYGKADLARLTFIRHSRDLGFSIEDIGELLELSRHPEEPCADAHAIAARQLRDIRGKISRLKKLETELDRICACDGGRVADCAVIETLADHDHCVTEH